MKTHSDLKAMIEKHIEFLEGIGADIQSWTITKPASEAEIVRVERELGFAIPPKLRQVYSSLAASIDFDWVHLDERLEDHELYVAKGAVNWNLARLKPDLDLAKAWPSGTGHDPESAWGRVWTSTLPVVDVGCGDYIGVSLPTTEAVVYLNHEAPDQHGAVIAPDFPTLLEEWGNLMFPGPDWAYWQCFLSGPKRYIASKTKRAQNWRRWLAGELDD
jgi:hypothetical protein